MRLGCLQTNVIKKEQMKITLYYYSQKSEKMQNTRKFAPRLFMYSKNQINSYLL